jgi:hypothetical protein
VDSDGVIRSAATNLLLRSEEFDNASWTKARATVSQNTAVAPNGSVTADTIVEDTTSNSHIVLQGVSGALSATAYTASVYVKANVRSRVRLALFGTANTSLKFVDFDLSTGAILGTSGATGTILPSTGDGWFRCSVTTTTNSAGTVELYVWTLNDAGSSVYLGTGANALDVWGAQLEVGSTATTYIPTGATINSAPRFDHNPLTGECLGLLVEEQRQNLLLRSEEFDNASWTRTGFLAFGSGSTANAATAPNGTTTADLLVESTAVNAERTAYQTGIVATTGTLTVYAKASGRSHVGLRFYGASNNWVRATYTLTGAGAASVVSAGSSSDYSGTAASIEQFADGWYRVRLTATRGSGLAFAVVDFATTATPILQAVNGNEFYTGNGTSGLLLWGAQLEAGAFPTSYIPTTGTAATRTADVVSITGTNFSSWYRQDEGCVFVDAFNSAAPIGGAARRLFELNNNSEAERFFSGFNTTTTLQTLIQDNSVIQANLTQAIPGPVSASKIAASYKLDDLGIVANGGAVGSDTQCTLPTPTQLTIGYSTSGGNSTLNAPIRRLTYWPTRLPNSTLQSITL